MFLDEHDAILITDQTPTHSFAMVVAVLPGGKYCVAIPARDSFDDRLAADVLGMVRKRYRAIVRGGTVAVFDGFTSAGHSFDTVFVLSPDAAEQFKYDHPELSKVTFVAFPGFRCELSGDEVPDEVQLIRHKLLPTVDWHRSPCPKVGMAFRNVKRQNWSKGDAPGLTTLKRVNEEIRNLADSEESWVIVKNYTDRRYRIEWKDNEFIVMTDDRRTLTFDEAGVLEFVREFVIKNA
jgi:hypothetical protein